jgi:hypothetical protein
MAMCSVLGLALSSAVHRQTRSKRCPVHTIYDICVPGTLPGTRPGIPTHMIYDRHMYIFMDDILT